MRRDLADPELFGNEAGEDEDEEILDSYFLDKEEFDRFYSPQKRLAFVRSRKGMGKSTLLKQTLYKRQKTNPDELVIHVKASDLFALQDTPGQSSAEMIYGWQQRICTRINLELGATLRLGFTDDSMLLIESSEIAGFRNRNIVSALFDRLKIKGAGIEVERTRISANDSEQVLSRVLDKKDVIVWMSIDDIDATFINTEHERLKVSTFFSACRNIINNVKGLCIRASVRTDVWSILAQHDEALDKCEQYMLDLKWSTTDTGRILENKVLSFFVRYYGDDTRFTSLKPGTDSSKIRKLVFNEPFSWSGRHLEAFRPIHILSAGRPRWAAQLCKLAGSDAFAKKADKISIGHIRSILRPYGQLRVADLYKEHRHQCSRLEDLIESFSGGKKRYTTKDLMNHLVEKVVTPRGFPNIDGVTSEGGVVGIAHFLYRIGFITARDDEDVSGLGFIRFEDRPSLLTTKANLDDSMDWEIHPSYRSVLRIEKTQEADI